ncbi:MAG: hypothetical protein Q8M24_05020 [Pseudolabrys sp.]|nr:hypothetical protein [Pseudolabrys sp.]MDP2294807.1 hypothetical protein [Pseudolabrys sp.]
MENKAKGRKRATKRVALTALTMALALASASAFSQDKDDNSQCSTTYVNGKPFTYCAPRPRPAVQPRAMQDGAVIENGVGAATATGTGSKPSSVTRDVIFERAARDAGEATSVRRPASAPPQTTAAGRQPSLRTLHAVRGLMDTNDAPPRDVAGYGIVAFTTKPLAQDVERYKSVCEAFKATLMAAADVSANVPAGDQMVTFWPVTNKSTAEAQRGDCAHLVANYALGPALSAIQDADKLKEGLSTRRGPFLIAWAPSDSRYKPDAIVLVMELSSIESQRSFLEVFQDWRSKIVDNPELWRRGFDVESMRRTIRDTFDRYGDRLVRLIKPSS